MTISNSLLKEAKLKTDQLIECDDPEFITSEACFYLRSLCDYLKENFSGADNYKKILFLALMDNRMNLDKAPADTVEFIKSTGVFDLDIIESEKLRKISSVFFN